MSNHKRLLPRPNQEKNISPIPPVIRENENHAEQRTPTPEKCRLEYYQKRELTNREIKAQISELYKNPETRSDYKMETIKASQTKFTTGKYAGEKYSEVLKKDAKCIHHMLKNEWVKNPALRDYLILSLPARLLY